MESKSRRRSWGTIGKPAARSRWRAPPLREHQARPGRVRPGRSAQVKTCYAAPVGAVALDLLSTLDNEFKERLSQQYNTRARAP